MFGFIVTTHYNNYKLISKCLDLLFINIPPNSTILLYVNETTDDKVLNIKSEYVNDSSNKIYVDFEDENGLNIQTLNHTFEVFYIQDQLKNNGLTGTWNMGIKHLINNYPDIKVITILGHDTFLNSTINFLYKKAMDAYKNKILEYYGPLYLYWKGKTDELWQDQFHFKNYEQKYLIGSLLCFPINSLIKNILPSGDFFDNQYPFGYNDIDWYNRFKKIGGKPVIIPECIIDHKYCRTWINVDPRLKNYRDNKQNNIENTCISNLSVEKLLNKYNTIQENNFNWIMYSQKWQHLKFKNERQAYDHYMTKGRYLR